MNWSRARCSPAGTSTSGWMERDALRGARERTGDASPTEAPRAVPPAEAEDCGEPDGAASSGPATGTGCVVVVVAGADTVTDATDASRPGPTRHAVATTT